MSILKRFIQRNYTKGRGGKKITQITMHTAVSSASSLFSWFNKDSTNASSHYYVNKDGIVEQYVEESDTAFANSNLASNQRSITIETWDGGNPNDPIRTDALYNSLAHLVADICKRYGIPPVLLTKEQSQTNTKGITQHRFFANKSCPAGLDLNRVVKTVESILNLDYNQDMTFSEVIKKERPDVEKAGVNPDEWWVSYGHKELMDVLDRLSRVDVIEHINKADDEINASKDWYYKYGSREYANIWNEPQRLLEAQNQRIELEGTKTTIQLLKTELEALKLQINAYEATMSKTDEKIKILSDENETLKKENGDLMEKYAKLEITLDEYKEKYSQELIKNEMIIVEKNEKIHSLEKKIAEYKTSGVESLDWKELFVLAFNKLLKKE